MEKLYRNPEIKSITIKIVILCFVFLIFTLVTMNIGINNINKKVIRQNAAVLGIVLEENPELEKNIVGYFTKGISEDQIKSGLATLEKYSYNETLKPVDIPLIREASKSLLFNVLTVNIIFFITIFFIVLLDYKKILSKINIVSSSVERVLEGEYDMTLEGGEEGEFSILYNQLNLLVNRLIENMEKLKKEKEFLRNIISDISHQLKTPLSSIIMLNELMTSKDDMDEETKVKFLNKTSEQLTRMEWLIINLLKIARVEAGAINYKMKNQPLIITINKAFSPLKEKAKTKKQNIIIEDKRDVYLNHDSDWMTEAIGNIIKNAIEHTEEYGTISIEIKESPLLVSIIIKDNGNGIKKEELPHIFERFYKGKHEVKPISIGIGLTLSKSIIESNGGSISVKSIEGEGTEFVITFLKSIV
ncbi:sensor histidine kinase [Clostridium sp. UBA6640]|uniref:sensor histidine kinase n=1 Tax=Clostridium sp. UBA6640 TaxID=1946370 RepID=UPI0025BB8413|nr:HAMP domain-containing sensor histidine kinase [Clostridium sp. UBA6640]